MRSLWLIALLMPALASAEDGDVKFSPSLGVSYTRNDNFYSQANTANKVVTNGVVLSPSVAVSAKTARANLSASVSTSYARYDTRGGRDNFNDPVFNGSLGYKLGSDQTIGLNLSGTYGHDPFGQDRTQGVAVANQELDLWVQGGGSLNYQLGAPGALFNFAFGANGTRKAYQTNTAQTEPLNYSNYGGNATVFLNISPKTSLLVGGGYSQVRFDRLFNATDQREGDQYFAHVGARWKAAAKTTGDVRAGFSQRNATATGARTFQVLDWVATITWQPESRTTFTVATGLQTAESFLAGASVILNRSSTLTWSQTWGQKWSSTVNGGYTQGEFVGIARKDDTTSAGLSLSYKPQKYLGFGLGGNYVHRSSDAAASSYTGFSVSSNVNLSF